jgi:hypothetical protein
MMDHLIRWRYSRHDCRSKRLFGSNAPPQDTHLNVGRGGADIENQFGVCLLARSTRSYR